MKRWSLVIDNKNSNKGAPVFEVDPANPRPPPTGFRESMFMLRSGTMLYRLPTQLADATLIQLPQLWLLIVRCPCNHTHIASVDRLARRHGLGRTPRELAARFRCRHCQRRPAAMVLRETPQPGEDSPTWTPQEAVITFPPPPPLPPPGPDDIPYDWSAPPPPQHRPR